MTLEQWRQAQGYSYAKLAQKVGASHATVARRWCLPADHKDRMMPTPEFMRLIELASLGQVKPNDFYRDLT